ncbi:MAG: energy-coupled thiamine transporter ThiT [Coriobacteriia bacterium]|nr:energy-coupled thiamine transporter ThiT [Coriobacteriia bacterium]
MRNERIRTIAEIGLSVALFAVLDYLNVRLPINAAGGSISLAMTPILILALFRGPLVGMLAGALCGGIDFLIAPYIFNVFQVFLDYPIAFGLVGLAGLFKKPAEHAFMKSKTTSLLVYTIGGILIGAVGRFLAHFLSGVIFFAQNAPKGQNVFLYSAGYQLTYLVPSFIGCAIVTVLIVPVLARSMWEKQS